MHTPGLTYQKNRFSKPIDKMTYIQRCTVGSHLIKKKSCMSNQIGFRETYEK